MLHMKDLLLDIFKNLNISADPGRFEVFCKELLHANEVMNLTAITKPEEVAVRHFADSLALLNVMDFSGKRVIDVGCGAGFPGLPLRLAREDISLTLLDALKKRISFLEGVCERLSLTGVECVHARAEELAAKAEYRESYDIAVSRAVADLSMLCELTLPFVKVGGAFVAMKSVSCEEELVAAEKAISALGGELDKKADYPLYNTGITRMALVIRKVRPTPEKYPRRFAKIKSKPL